MGKVSASYITCGHVGSKKKESWKSEGLSQVETLVLGLSDMVCSSLDVEVVETD